MWGYRFIGLRYHFIGNRGSQSSNAGVLFRLGKLRLPQAPLWKSWVQPYGVVHKRRRSVSSNCRIDEKRAHRFIGSASRSEGMKSRRGTKSSDPAAVANEQLRGTNSSEGPVTLYCALNQR